MSTSTRSRSPGTLGDTARTGDRVAEAEDCLKRLEEMAKEADATVWVEHEVMVKLREENASEDLLAEKDAVIERSRRIAERARRRAAKIVAFKEAKEQHLEDVANGVERNDTAGAQGTAGEES